MPKHCCVPGCTSNYASDEEPYKSVFKFPKDTDRKAEWLKNIPRSQWVPSSSSVVCIKHFLPEDVETLENYIDHNNERKTRPKDRPSLKKDAVPRIFPNLPSSLNVLKPTTRQTPDERRQHIVERQNEKVVKFLENDLLSDFEALSNYNEILKNISCEWKFMKNDSECVFFILSTDDVPRVPVSVKIQENLDVSVFLDGLDMGKDNLKWIVPSGKLQRWSQLENILSRYRNKCEEKEVQPEKEYNKLVNAAKSKLLELKVFLDCYKEEELIDSKPVSFLIDQFLLCTLKRKVYSTLIFQVAFMIMYISSACYEAIQKQNILFFPDARYLKRIASLSPTNNESVFLKSLEQKLSKREKYINLLIDEMYVNPSIHYKSGSLFGYAQNQICNAAKTIQTFMITSIFGSMSSVVKLIPVKNMTGVELAELTKKVIHFVQEHGFIVVTVITDNNRINRTMFNILSSRPGNECSYKMINEKYGSFIYLLFDTVHLLKSLRNNWLNQSDEAKTFVFPEFNANTGHVGNIFKASFSVLRDLYKIESSKLLKCASKLNYKSVYPSSIERQKVILACNIFSPETIIALSSMGYSEVVHFLNIINRWWTVVNVKSKGVCVRKREPDASAFTSKNDDRLEFLRQFVLWLKQWMSLSVPYGRLTKDTMHALIQTNSALVELIEHCIDLEEVEYVLPGKFQTDKLENRFSSYRQLSGGNYNVSVLQVLEAEKKIKLQNLLGLKSARYKEVLLHENALSQSCEEVTNCDRSGHFQEFNTVIEEVSSVDVNVEHYPVVYVSGYVAFKMNSKLNCCGCSNFISTECTDCEMFQEINRGGLSVPSDLLIDICLKVYSVMQLLISAEYEQKFIECKAQKLLLIELAQKLLKDTLEIDYHNVFCEVCEKPANVIMSLALPYFSNILINNYAKQQNDIIAAGKISGKKRKLITFN